MLLTDGVTPLYDHFGPLLRQIAAAAHGEETDKQGVLYLHHYRRAEGYLRQIAATEKADDQNLDLALCALAIHDVIEDHKEDGFTFENLAARGVPKEILEVAALLTHEPEEPYADYVLSLSRNPAARLAKRADLADNSDYSRILLRPATYPSDADRLQRYHLSAQFLEGKIGQAAYLAKMKCCEKPRKLLPGDITPPAPVPASRSALTQALAR